MRLLPLLAGIAVLAACSREQQRFVPNADDPEVTPTMSTRDVSTLISDSGYTRYHLTAPLWEMFEDAEEPFWRFPDGLEVEQFDLQLNPESTVVCDSAIYFSQKRLWRLDGNVVMVNTEADSFLTQQLFWNQAERKIYSDSFIHIVRSDRTIEGYGFESDQSMVYYTVHRPTAILPANRPGGSRHDADSTSARPSAAADSTCTSHPLPSRPQNPKPRQRSQAPTGFLVSDEAAAAAAPKK